MIKNYTEFLNETAEYHNLHGDDDHNITIIKRDNKHKYEYCDGVMYELSNSGEDVVAYISEIEHTEENTFYQDQIDRYIEYINDGGVLESFPVNTSPLGDAYNLEAMCEYLGENDNFDLNWDILKKNHEELWDIVDKLSYDSETYGIDMDILIKIRNKADLDKYYGEDTYDKEHEEDEHLRWKKEYYDGFVTILEYWEENKAYTLTDMNHRFAALKELGKKRVYVDPS